MLKIIGAVFIAGSALAMGVNAAEQLKRHADDLSELIYALGIMKNEISLRLTPMRELTEKLSKETVGAVSELFARCGEMLPELGSRSFMSIWKESVEKTPLLLKKQEKDTLAELGAVLGRYDAAAQLKAIDYCSARLEDFLKTAETDARSKGRTRTAAGLAVGLMLVIMFI